MDVEEAADDLKAAAEDIVGCGYQGAADALERFLATLDSGPFGRLLAGALPAVDFAAWYGMAKATVGGMVGSGRLRWPVDIRERVAMQLSLLRAIQKNEPTLEGFMADFFYADSSLDLCYLEFVQRFLQPFLRDLSRILDRTAATAGSGEEIEMTTRQPDARKVFVVHGRNNAAREAMFTFLRSIGLHPIEWAEATSLAPGATPYIGQRLDAAFATEQAVVVLLTGDDEARLREQLQGAHEEAYETQLTPQARPNVLFEAGLAFGSRPERTVLVELGRLRPFSDIGGRHTVRLTSSTQRRQELAMRLRKAGCEVNIDGTDWHTAGDFDGSIAAGTS